jgi:hypothetical protein
MITLPSTQARRCSAAPRHISTPLMCGIIQSSSTTSGWSVRRDCESCRTVRLKVDLESGALKHEHDHVPEVGVVVDNEGDSAFYESSLTGGR